MAVQLDVVHAVVLGPGEGEVVAETATRSSRIKVVRDELLVLESWSAAGERGAAPHLHRGHADAFYVLEGSLTFHARGREHTAPAGSFAVAPADAVHGFSVGDEGARYLNVHAPGGAYAALVRARRDGMPCDAAEGDTFDASPSTTDAVVVAPGDGEPISRVVIKAALTELVLTEMAYDAGGRGPVKHVHKRHSDSFYVLEGELDFELGDETVRASAGSFVLAPPDFPHTFSNPGPSRARFLNLHTPGMRFDEYLRERRRVADDEDPEFLAGFDVYNVTGHG